MSTELLFSIGYAIMFVLFCSWIIVLKRHIRYLSRTVDDLLKRNEQLYSAIGVSMAFKAATDALKTYKSKEPN